MKWLTRISNLLGRRETRGLGGGAYGGIGAYLPTAVLSGIAVTPETALTLTAAFSAINTLATDTAALPLRVYRRLPKGERRYAPEHPVDELLSFEPNPDTTPIRFRQASMGHCLGWGNSYCEIVRDPGDGTPLELQLLSPRPTETQPEYTRSGRLFYRQRRDDLKFRPEDVLHVAGLGFDGLMGYSPITLARQAIGLGIAAEEFGASLFGNGSIPKGVLKTTKRLNAEAAANLRRSWEAMHQGTKSANGTAVLEEGMTWESITIPPEDAQFLVTRQFQVVEIARLYRLPPHKIGDYTRATFANIEEANQDYLMTSLMPWLIQIEQEWGRKLLSRDDRRAGYYLRHDMSALLRGNMTARSAFYKTMEEIGVLSPNQIAEMEDQDPIENGNIHFVPMNMSILETLKADPAAPDQGAAEPAAEPVAA